MRNILFITILFSLFACSEENRTNSELVREEIISEMERNENAWNDGDLLSYMRTYNKSDSIRFAGNNSYRFGWENVLATYQKGYPDNETMGNLTFSELDITPITNSDALVFGRFTVITNSDTSTGLFTLLMKNFNNDWRIVHDHSSSNR